MDLIQFLGIVKVGEKKDENAFIFSINNKKMFKTTNPKRSIYCSGEYGPFFEGNYSSDYELWFYEADNCGFIIIKYIQIKNVLKDSILLD